MGIQHRGFIPLVAILLLSLVAVAGGTAAVIYVNNASAPEEPLQSSATESQETPGTTSPGTEQQTSSSVETPVAIKIETRLIAPPISARTKEICEDVMARPAPGKPSLLQDAQTLCEQLGKPAEDSVEQREQWISLEGRLEDRWNLKVQIDASNESSEERARTIDATR